MDIFEKIFEKVWTPDWKIKKQQSSTIHLEIIKPYLEIICAYCLERNASFNIVASKFFIGGNQNQIHLPEYIPISSEPKINKRLYLYLSMVSCAAIKLNLKTSYPQLKSRIAKRIEFQSHMPKINLLLDKQFPEFKNLQEKILFDIQPKKNHFNSPKGHELINLWKSLTIKRDNLSLSEINLISDLIIQQKANDQTPDFLLYSTPCLGTTIDFAIISSPNIEENEHSRNMTEKTKEGTEELKKVDLNEEKKKDNPVTHSFEKMETLDDYQGGHRTASGDDELKSHENALNELELNQITIDGENSKSLYRSNSKLLFQFSEGQTTPPDNLEQSIPYPEWSQSKNQYLENFCHLYLHSPKINDGRVHENYIKDLMDKYKKQINQIRSKINAIYNEPLWKYQQKDGQEIDHDSVVKYLINLRGGAVSESNFYAEKRHLRKDISVYFLFDQSLSTDSWIKNHRVLDTIIDSLCLAGLFFKDLIENIHIAGTWSATRRHCHYINYKECHESWDRFFAISKDITPTGYTRLGPALRHSIKRIEKDNFRKKILILLTDGKPTDLDRYEGQHGIYDIKKACQEAEDAGIFIYALTIGKEEKFYFSQMFKHYFTISHPEQFPEQIINILLHVLKR